MNYLPWIIVVFSVLILYFVFGLWSVARDHRLTATISIRNGSSPSAAFAPENPTPEDLIRLGLVYAAKLRWVLFTDPLTHQDAFDLLLTEICRAWEAPHGDLLKRVEATTGILVEAGPQSDQQQFVIRYSRSRFKSRRNSSSISNSLPKDCPITNALWSIVVIWDAIHQKVGSQTNGIAGRALKHLAANLVSESDDRSLSGLLRMITIADEAWERAATA